MSDDLVNIEVDGRQLQARKGQMLIEVTDEAGIYVPRFCYHEKLSIAANCRMCLVEVEKAPKPLPACATPVNEGMKVFTDSAKAVSAQKATMEFLLINHPLDCPICDQGGECELQDLAMGFGRDVSRYTEGKRVVKDKDLGPLVSTDMTRCIHCTRCVRFGQEIAGIQELGTTDRGENMKIGTYIEKSVDHELSGNIIDICPVGALNNKPYRYSARAWEMVQRPMVSPHDCVGSNLYAHVLRGTVKRVVPRNNEAVNETWIADRDRFSYEGIYSDARLREPMIRKDGHWVTASWEDALALATGRLAESAAANASDVALLATPGATLEECHLIARLADHLGTPNLDHRLRRQDFRDQDADPAFPWLGSSLESLEALDSLLVVGSNLRKEAPLLAHRVRKAALNGAAVSFLNEQRYPYFFDTAACAQGPLVAELAAVLLVLAEQVGGNLPEAVAACAEGVEPGDEHRRAAGKLAEAESSLVLLGNIAQRHPRFSELRVLAATVAELSGGAIGYVSEGANSAGAALAGVLPHRKAGGIARSQRGRDVGSLLQAPPGNMLLFGGDPAADFLPGAGAVSALAEAAFVVAITPYRTDGLERCADVMLPMGTAFETSGTFLNGEGRIQSFAGVANPVGEARPGWKILRVIGNLLEAPAFDYVSSEEVRDEILGLIGELRPDNRYTGEFVCGGPERVEPAITGAALDVPIYQVDGLVRHARALQLTNDGRQGREQEAGT
ncbi:MAG: NADH-quinone oxidoreductase subunit NuoG [Gammaproteobacteria bacterium]